MKQRQTQLNIIKNKNEPTPKSPFYRRFETKFTIQYC